MPRRPTGLDPELGACPPEVESLFRCLLGGPHAGKPGGGGGGGAFGAGGRRESRASDASGRGGAPDDDFKTLTSALQVGASSLP